MAHLWMKHEGREWAVLPLDGKRLELGGRLPAPAGAGPGGAGSRDGGRSPRAGLLRSAGPAGPQWTLLGDDDGVLVNGLPLSLGIRVLRDRDEIRVAGRDSVFFSTERLARLEPYPGGAEPILCARCKLEIVKDSIVVRCPACDLWHHQGPDPDGEVRECWTYHDKCSLCPQPTDPEAGFAWTPEEL